MSINLSSNSGASKKILTALSIYGASAWLLIQVAATVRPYLKFSESIVTALIYTIILCFPLYLFYLWVIHTNPISNSIRLTQLYHWLKKLDKRPWAIFAFPIVIFTSALLFLGNIKNVTSQELGFDLKDKLAVLQFENLTGDDKLGMIGPMVSHWLTDGFIEHGDIKVVSASAVERAYQTNSLNKLNPGLDFTKILGTKFVIDGSYFMQKNKLYLKSNLVNIETGEIIFSFGDCSGPKDEPIQIIEMLRNKVLGYWYNKEKTDRYPAPNFDSYQKYIEAKNEWGYDFKKVNMLLDESIKLDSNFQEPKFLKLSILRNEKNWMEFDSILDDLSSNKLKLTQIQKDKLKFFQFELKGDYKSAFKYMFIEYNNEYDLFANTSVMYYTNHLLNDPASCIKVSEKIPMDSIDFEDCEHCVQRLYDLGHSYLKLENYKAFDKAFEYRPKLKASKKLQELQLIVLVNQKLKPELESLMQKYATTVNKNWYLEYVLLISNEYLKLGDEISSKKWLDLFNTHIGEADQNNFLTKELLAQYYEMSNQLEKAKKVYLELIAAYPDDAFYNYRMAGIIAQSGNCAIAKRIEKQLYANRPDHDFGYNEYEMARIYALCGDKTTALKMLEQSIDNGRAYHIKFFDRDWYLRALWDNENFKALLNKRKS